MSNLGARKKPLKSAVFRGKSTGTIEKWLGAIEESGQCAASRQFWNDPVGNRSEGIHA